MKDRTRRCRSSLLAQARRCCNGGDVNPQNQIPNAFPVIGCSGPRCGARLNNLNEWENNSIYMKDSYEFLDYLAKSGTFIFPK